MDWSDDVAYSVHDVEDGVHSGHIRLGRDRRRGPARRCARWRPSCTRRCRPAELAPVLDALLDLPTIKDLAGYDGSYAAQAAAKRATSELTGRFAGAAAARHPGGVRRAGAPLRRRPGRPGRDRGRVRAAQGGRGALRDAPGRARTSGWPRQRQLLTELVEAVLAGAPGTLDPVQAAAWREAADDAARLRVVIDQVAQLTDPSAVAWHARLVRPRRA